MAITGVIASHAVAAADPRATLLLGGGIGVWIFFTLSGYLITTLLLREAARSGRIQRARFYARRALRLLPALVVLVVVCDVWALTSGSGALQSQTLGGTPGALFYFGNWVRALDPRQNLGVLGHTWSLSVEEQFYIAWPLVVMLLVRWRRPKGAVAVALAGVVLSIGARVLAVLGSGWGPRELEGTDTIADTLLLGCAVALVLHHWRGEQFRTALQSSLRWAVWPAVAVLAAILLLPAHAGFFSTVRFVIPAPTVVGACSAVVIAFIVTAPASSLARFLGARPLRWVGQVSYSLYLWHLPVIAIVNSGAGVPSLLRVPVEIALCIALAAASYYLVEQPVMRWRKRVVPVADTPVAVSRDLAAAAPAL